VDLCNKEKGRRMIATIGYELVALAALVAFFAGIVKGMVGFAMPTIMISGISSFLSVEVALAMLILPTLMTNGAQALRQGWRAAWASIQQYRVFLMVGGVFLLIGAQMVSMLPPQVLFLLIGVPISLFALMQLIGWQMKIPPEKRRAAEFKIASIAGFVGGMSGVWGPPTVAYLTAIGTPKQEQVRVQGAVYGLGALALLIAHIWTGVISVERLPLSVLMLVPAGIGMLIGFNIQDRLDQQKFRQATLFVLVIAGLNLMRRGVMG